MTRFISLLPEGATMAAGHPIEYASTRTIESEAFPGVTYTIYRMSFGRRVELTKRIRELGQKIEFLEAGSDVRDKIEAAFLAHQIEKLYLEWGLREVRGLVIDGHEAGPAELIESGPEELCREIVSAIKAECGLTESERKN
jgi:hypothetical protein